jgi:hypothetical protein
MQFWCCHLKTALKRLMTGWFSKILLKRIYSNGVSVSDGMALLPYFVKICQQWTKEMMTGKFERSLRTATLPLTHRKNIPALNLDGLMWNARVAARPCNWYDHSLLGPFAHSIKESTSTMSWMTVACSSVTNVTLLAFGRPNYQVFTYTN